MISLKRWKRETELVFVYITKAYSNSDLFVGKEAGWYEVIQKEYIVGKNADVSQVCLGVRMSELRTKG